jgi:hypothetical protein
LERGDFALVQEGVDGFVDGGRVANVHVLALAVGGAFSFESPNQADGLVLVLRDGGILSIHHGLDGGVTGVSEASHHVSICMAVEDGN